MKINKLTGTVGTTLALVLLLAGCGQSNYKKSQDHSKASMQNTAKTVNVKKQITKTKHLWYLTDSINGNASHGIDAYYFKDNKVTLYSADKVYTSLAAAKKAHGLNKQGTLTYTVSGTKSAPKFKMKGKLSGISMTQTLTIKNKTVNGTNKATHHKMTGYKAVHDLDGDRANRVLVRVK
ncbi:hypothetical protein [Lentilactobacillus kribbianus]|uniref:hypothetical protein n=1 Tax=Lentilactobacillus kribbianus TaxID=2729622 RepID=UPI0015571451|nr:hypothetical protein [Lentilactobacillus kribbianus]